MKTNENKRIEFNLMLLIIRIILIAIIIICSIYIVNWYIENKKSANMLKEITDSSIIGTNTIEIPIDSNEGTGDDSNGENTNPNEAKKIQISTYELDFDKLLSINKSTVGWISVPNTSINYPVAQASNNDFYLNHSFDNSKNSAGWIFADYRNKFDGTDKNIIIYGHNRMDSSMFATLKNTQKSNWYNNQNNKYVTITTPSGTIVYETFSVYTIPSESYYLATQFSSDESYLEFLNTLKSRSVHDFGVSLDADDSILTLSTCDSTGKSRVILHAKKIF